MKPKKIKRVQLKSQEVENNLAVSESVIIREAAKLLMTDPDIAEAFTQADLELALEDRDWVGGLGGPSSEKWTCDLAPQQRRLLIERSRMYWHRDPLAHQAVRLWTDYCFGETGMAITTDDEKLDSQIKKFLMDPRNRNYFSAQGQKRISNRLLVDGDLFLAIFDDGTVRSFDALQMTLLKDPDDEDIILGYKRRTNDNKTLYYCDWAYEDRKDEIVDDVTNRAPKEGIETDVVLYRISFDPLGHYGNGLLNTSTSWSSAHRRFMQARVTLLEALSKIAYKLTVKGGANAVAVAKSKLQSSMVDGGTANGVERNPTSAPASTYIGNAGADLQPMPRTTAAGDAREDSNNLKLMVSAGTGIFLHYFGDPSTGNLATATAMELPMMKMFGGYQQLWKDAIRDIIAILLDKDPSELDIDVNLPPLIQDDLQKLGTFLTALTTVFPEAKVPDVLRECLVSMQVEDVDSVMEAMDAKRVEIDAQTAADKAAALNNPQNGANQNQGPNKDPGIGADYAEKFAKLTEAFDRLSKLL